MAKRKKGKDAKWFSKQYTENLYSGAVEGYVVPGIRHVTLG